MSGPDLSAAVPGAERSGDVARRALQRLLLSGALRTVDAAFADLLRRLGAGPEVALAGALAMRAVALGDSGFALTRAQALLAALEASATLPEPEAWREALRASPWVALSAAPGPASAHGPRDAAQAEATDGRPDPSPPHQALAPHQPLLVFEHDRVALLRYARFEHDLACRLLERHGSWSSGRSSGSSGTPTFLTGSSGTPTFLTADEIDRGVAGNSGTPGNLGNLGMGNLGTPTHLTPSRDTHPQSLVRLRQLFALSGPVVDPNSAPAPAALDRQALAALIALRRHLLLLTGGPGTGKTTTVARLLALAVEDARAHGLPPPRIALAAPTGRAAARLAEAVGAQLARDLAEGRLDAPLAEAVPRQASTLHRLLGVRPGEPGFRHHAQRPLPFDLVVVDEASMIDLPLMDRLVAAVAPEARLVLIGDPDQLPAVEAGDVLGALCAAAGDGLAVAAEDASAAALALGVPVPALGVPIPALPVPDQTVGVPVSLVSPLPVSTPSTTVGVPVAPPVPALGVPIPALLVPDRTVGVPVASTTVGVPVAPPLAPPPLPLGGARVQLTHGWRQAGALPLQAFAAAVRAGDAARALALLPAREASALATATATADAGASHADAGDPALQRLHGDPAALAAFLRAWALPVFAAVRDADSAADALALAQRLRLLTALRRGPFGAETWNAWCAAELGARGRWFHGALIAIAANSRHHGLYNGDLGVIRRDSDGGLKAWFALREAGGETRWRGWRPAQLPAHDLAFATTVHKAQGSEFAQVALILPDRDSRALGRELLYTAATRARRALWLWAAPERVREAIERPATRDSGLLARLRAGA